MDYAALAKQLGGGVMQQPQQQPQQQPDWMGGLSPKDQAELTMKMHGESRKRIAELDDEIAKGAAILGDLDRFGELNRRSATGGVWENVLPSVPLLHGSDENEMYKIQSRLGPSQRAVGSGSSSDRDVSLFLSGLPSTTDKGNVNRDVRMSFQKKYDLAVEKKKAMEDYLNLRGNLMGFDTEWQKMKSKYAPTEQPATNAKPVATYDLPPNAKQYEGKTLRDTKSGKRFKSVNGKWVQQ